MIPTTFNTAIPRNTLTDDIRLMFTGFYGQIQGADPSTRFKIVMFLVLYHDAKKRAQLVGDVWGAYRNLENLKRVMQSLSTECQQILQVRGRIRELTHTAVQEAYYVARAQRYPDRYDQIDTYRSGIEYFLDCITSEFDLEHLWPSELTLACSELKADAVDKTLFQWINQMLTWDIGRIDLGSENRQLRELLAAQVGGMGIYRDDGELSDSSAHPGIDFRRASPRGIRAALRRRSQNAQNQALANALATDIGAET